MPAIVSMNANFESEWARLSLVYCLPSSAVVKLTDGKLINFFDSTHLTSNMVYQIIMCLYSSPAKEPKPNVLTCSILCSYYYYVASIKSFVCFEFYFQDDLLNWNLGYAAQDDRQQICVIKNKIASNSFLGIFVERWSELYSEQMAVYLDLWMKSIFVHVGFSILILNSSATVQNNVGSCMSFLSLLIYPHPYFWYRYSSGGSSNNRQVLISSGE